MKQAVILIAIVASIVGVMLWARPEGGFKPASTFGDTGAPSALVASEKTYDFGTISMRDGVVEHSFAITNPTDKDIKLAKLSTSCMCTTAYWQTEDKDGANAVTGTPASYEGPFGMESMGYVPPLDDAIKAGETRYLKVVFDPNAHGPAGVGVMDRFATLVDASGGSLTVEVKSVVTP